MSSYGSLDAEVGVFGPAELDRARDFYLEHGFAVIRGLWSEAYIDRLDAACGQAQTDLAAGRLDERHRSRDNFDPTDGSATPTVHYVLHISEIVEQVREAFHEPAVRGLVTELIGTNWLLEGGLFGVVFQDARSDENSGYSRIGWHSDWQGGPHLDRWPATAITVHLDATSPANGFLRVLPGSHLWATPAPPVAEKPAGWQDTGGRTDQAPPVEMPDAFQGIPGELALYCRRGDVLLHDCYLWHAAARGTDDTLGRRHLRGSWYTGREEQGVVPGQFVKNAAR
jgi:hypothetical protein